MYNEEGETTWQRSLDSNGAVKHGDNSSCPFLYQGQYYDEETELAYNRFRYYSPDSGTYISQDPIGLLSGEYNLYAYTKDSNTYIDLFGLAGEPIIFHSTGGGVIHPRTITPNNPHGIYTIDATGYNGGDRASLIETSKIKNPGGNYHAHHIDYDPKTNTMRMQMVHKDYHGTHSHIGGGNDFKQDTGFKYGSDDAITEANKRNKAKLKGCN